MTLHTTTWTLTSFILLSILAAACDPSELEPFCRDNDDTCQPTVPSAGEGTATSTGTSGAGGDSPGSTGGGSGGASTHTTTSGHGGDVNEGGAGGAGASGPCDPAQTTCACDAEGACADANLKCVSGLCIDATCSFSYECGAGSVCANGACVAGCDASTPCVAGYACDKGICQVDPVNPACSAEQPCVGDGQICAGGLCAAACATNAECGDGLLCDASVGACVPDPSPKVGCNADKPCTGAGQECMADGYCHYACAAVTECKLIDSRFVACGGGVCMSQAEANPECTFEHPCPDGKDCIANKCL